MWIGIALLTPLNQSNIRYLGLPISAVDPRRSTSDRIQSALAYAKRYLDEPLTVGQLAKAAHLSPRQFSRAFRAETG